MYRVPVLLTLSSLLCMPLSLRAEVGETDLNDLSEQQNAVKINKCCEPNELMIDSKCRVAEQYNRTIWEPMFKTEDGKDTKVKYYNIVAGIPNCETTQQRAIFSFGNSEDELQLLSDGRLRHLIHHEHGSEIREDPLITMTNSFSIHEAIPIPEVKEPASYIHIQNKYCMDKIFMSKTNMTAAYALVCVPEVKINWGDSDFLMKKVLNPLFHAISMILLLLVAIIYFVLPTLRDLAGNIITTISMCLICAQAADLVRVFTELSNHVSFMIADIVLYVSLLGGFFWLNSFGFYIWKTFKSRNVFLRVTDVRKYCYYSSVVWSCVAVMTAMAICAHFLLDTSNNPYRKMRTQFSSSILTDDVEQETIGTVMTAMAICAHFLLDTSNNPYRKMRTQFSSSILTDDVEQETIGWLGIAIFFTPVAFTILFNIFFYITTLKVIKRINIYGRIHYKLKGCFDLFLQLFLIMSVTWLFLLLSWMNYDGLLYAYIVVNLLQGILVFYVCVLRQSHVTFLLRKSCCYAEPVPTGEWGDEMTQMNGYNGY